MKAEKVVPLRTGRGIEPIRSANDEFDPYRAAARPPEPNACPSCHASFTEGKWSWTRGPKDSFDNLCPACQRTNDSFPAGYVTIKGPFLATNRDAIITLIKDLEKKEKAERPMQRLMDIEDISGGILVTTTEPLLARGIAEALVEAFKGDLKLKYSRDENLLRATWKR
jgi:hypothetical protein